MGDEIFHAFPDRNADERADAAFVRVTEAPAACTDEHG
jgi:hypothetical protein